MFRFFLLGLFFVISTVGASDEQVDSICADFLESDDEYREEVRANLSLIKNTELRTKVVEAATTLFPDNKIGRRWQLLKRVNKAVWGVGDGHRIFDGPLLKLLDKSLKNKDHILKMEELDRISAAVNIITLRELVQEELKTADVSVADWLCVAENWSNEHYFLIVKAVDYMNGLPKDMLPLLIQTAKNSAGDNGIHRLERVISCANFHRSLIMKGYKAHWSFMFKVLLRFSTDKSIVHKSLSEAFYEEYLPNLKVLPKKQVVVG